eukprot:2422545-Prymnesium_polylepis.1
MELLSGTAKADNPIPALLARDGKCGVEVGNGVALGQVGDAVVARVRLQGRQSLAGAESRALSALLGDAPEVGWGEGGVMVDRATTRHPLTATIMHGGQAAE